MSTLVLLTRPAPRNASLAARLQADGYAVTCLPALALHTLIDTPDQMVWPDGYDLVVFVSSHAARSYIDCLQRWRPDTDWPSRVRVATVGLASARPVYQLGQVPAENIFHPGPGQQQDSEALWQVLRPELPHLRHVLIVRGETGREWLGEQFETHGIRVSRLALYRREPERWSAEQVTDLAEAFQRGKKTVFLLTSSESVDAVHANMQRLGLLSQWAASHFIVIHERISSRIQTILRTSGLYARYPIQICAPNDDAICQAIRLSVSHPGSNQDYNHGHDR
ncbi:MAG TPA: uroporphyrinogen-III synthase [Burkholderiaceae bacterium]|nr:uroporphyrinogen-III synthase [Burkholderiaceae bacterium]